MQVLQGLQGLLLGLQTALPAWAFDAVKFTNGLLLLVVLFVPLERLFALRPQRALRLAWGTDIAYYFITSLLPSKLIIATVALLLWLMHGFAPQGLFPGLAELPTALRFALALLVAELGFYWGHRAMHANGWLWRFHAVHHSAPTLDWLVNTRAHPVDLVITRLCGYLPLYVLGLAQPTGETLDWVPLLITLLASTWGYVLHANLRWPLAWLGRVVATPRFHHWHHAHHAHHAHPGTGGTQHSNYAATLPLMDLIFGTYLQDSGAWPERYGTDEPVPPALLDQLMSPFMGGAPKARSDDPPRSQKDNF